MPQWFIVKIRRYSIMVLGLIGIQSGGMFSGTTFGKSIVVTIKPIHSLVLSLLQKVPDTNVFLLCKTSVSPHHETLKPSQIRTLQTADLIITVGPSYESLMQTILEKVGKPTICLENTPNLMKKPLRFSCTPLEPTKVSFGLDGHFWLSLRNAQKIVRFLTDQLKLYLERRDQSQIEQNANHLLQRLRMFKNQMAVQILPLKTIPYGVYHDFLQYFDTEWGTQCCFGLSIHSDHSISPHALDQFRRNRVKPVCLFVDPQFSPYLKTCLRSQLQIPLISIDYLGFEIPEGSEAYFQIYESMVKSLMKGLLEKNQYSDAS
jgi:zinc transport system substrate-binding protein